MRLDWLLPYQMYTSLTVDDCNELVMMLFVIEEDLYI